ncbi:hypothetical protein FB451DRAFT_1182652 [Mycena latifolia]|nr:hypothetical protein FB451DRAFT_1182652 [Mycena latifolia]
MSLDDPDVLVGLAPDGVLLFSHTHAQTPHGGGGGEKCMQLAAARVPAVRFDAKRRADAQDARGGDARAAGVLEGVHTHAAHGPVARGPNRIRMRSHAVPPRVTVPIKKARPDASSQLPSASTHSATRAAMPDILIPHPRAVWRRQSRATHQTLDELARRLRAHDNALAHAGAPDEHGDAGVRCVVRAVCLLLSLLMSNAGARMKRPPTPKAHSTPRRDAPPAPRDAQRTHRMPRAQERPRMRGVLGGVRSRVDAASMTAGDAAHTPANARAGALAKTPSRRPKQLPTESAGGPRAFVAPGLPCQRGRAAGVRARIVVKPALPAKVPLAQSAGYTALSPPNTPSRAQRLKHTPASPAPRYTQLSGCTGT